MGFSSRRQWLLAALAQAGMLGWGRVGAANAPTAAAAAATATATATATTTAANATTATATATATATVSAPPTAPQVRPGVALRFPADHGAHPAFRTEWWYATGALHTQGGEALGFQVTFFRSRVGPPTVAPPWGRFDPRHLLFAHAALTDVAARAHWHAQRLGRWNGDPAAQPDHATLADTGLHLGGWALARHGPASAPSAAGGPSVPSGTTPSGSPNSAPSAAPPSSYRTRLSDEAFALDLTLTTTQPLLLQGEGGVSRKGPGAEQASFYYSQPQLAVAGTVRRGGRSDAVRGTAWLDHEWSETLLHPDAVGWDWVGMNLANGATLTAFRLRRADGSALWAGGSWRASGNAATQAFASTDLRWTALAHWASPQSGARYPVRWRLETPVGAFVVQSLLDAQELDSRHTTGTVYWEGLSELLHATTGQWLGLGYLEMTGYAGRLQL